ncbi:MAG: SPFH domain-containing protein [Thermoanaerobaculia bacterium]
MGLFDKISSQFIDIIEWLDDSSNTLVYRVPTYQQEIKMGAQLTVRENQVAIFINEGKAADVFGPGRYELSTQNLPILTTLRSWKYGFNSPFKAEVYFFNTRTFTDLKWGTANPVMMRDKDFGMVRIRAFGVYAMKLSDAKVFFNTIVGTQGLTTTEDIITQLRSTIVSRFSDALGESGIPAIDIATKYDELGLEAKQRVQGDFGEFGLELTRFVIENVSLPPEVEAAIDQRSKLGVLGGHLQQYTQMQAAEAIGKAAENPGGIAGAGVGLGAGVAMGQAMGQAFQGMGQQAPPPPVGGAAPPPPPAGGVQWTIAVEGKTYGPYAESALKQLVAGGQVAADAMAWKPGAAGWAPLSTFAEFGGGAAMPPPPPPPSVK